jgi:hypothetical protein
MARVIRRSARRLTMAKAGCSAPELPVENGAKNVGVIIGPGNIRIGIEALL